MGTTLKLGDMILFIEICDIQLLSVLSRKTMKYRHFCEAQCQRWVENLQYTN